MCAFPYFYVHLIDSVGLIAKRRLQQKNNSKHKTCIVLESGNENIMSMTYFLIYVRNVKSWSVTWELHEKQNIEYWQELDQSDRCLEHMT